jgi:repressor LexA
MSYGMTRRMRDCLDYIEACHQDSGVSPSYDEIKNHLNLRSKSGVHRLINSLEDRGLIKRVPALARTLMPTRLSPALTIVLPAELEHQLRITAALSQVTPEGFVASLIKSHLTKNTKKAAA